MTITERCRCGASITATGSEYAVGAGYQVSLWRREHNCIKPDLTTHDLPETSED